LKLGPSDLLMTDLTLEIEPSMFHNSVAQVSARPRQLDKNIPDFKGKKIQTWTAI
jgi:hypothetical protein